MSKSVTYFSRASYHSGLKAQTEALNSFKRSVYCSSFIRGSNIQISKRRGCMLSVLLQVVLELVPIVGVASIIVQTADRGEMTKMRLTHFTLNAR